MALERWGIRKIERETKLRIKGWAKRHGLEYGEALAKIIEIVEKVEGKR